MEESLDAGLVRPPREIGAGQWALLTLVGLFIILQVTHAWVVDDAYITLRTVDNFVNGMGLRWNPAERVQTYTHPLWMFALASVYAVTRESFYTTLALSFAVSLAAVLVVIRTPVLRAERHRAILFLGAILGSKSFLDYSSSGLENPLTHLLVALFYLRFLDPRPGQSTARRVGELSLIAALAFVNRMDSVVLFAPACVYLLHEHRSQLKSALRGAVLGSIPAIAWVVFALFYYGTVVPNTAIAKLSGPHVTLAERLAAGVAYFADSVMNDPISLLLAGVAIAASIASRSPRMIASAGGVFLYLLYVLSTGAIGTHMSGRFFSGPVFLSALMLAFMARHAMVALGACGLSALFLMASPVSPLRVGHDSYARPRLDRNDEAIIDTRAFVLDDGAALLNMVPGESMPRHEWYLAGKEYRKSSERVHVGGLVVSLPVGYSAFASGPEKHFIDVLGLADPLIARVPLPRDGDFRPGHFFRPMPAGYVATIERDRNVIEDPDLRRYYGAIREITRGPLFSTRRLTLVVEFNLGRYEHLLEAYARRNDLRH